MGVTRLVGCRWSGFGFLDQSGHIHKAEQVRRRHDVGVVDQAEIRRLKKELKRATEERDILKKAAVYFANQPD